MILLTSHGLRHFPPTTTATPFLFHEIFDLGASHAFAVDSFNSTYPLAYRLS
jgi:hypothetical protein